METLTLVLTSVESIGIIITLILSIYTLRQNNRLFLRQKKSEILTQKRSDRIDQLRKQSSIILAEGELKLLGKENNTSNLVYAVNTYSSLLQFIYAYEDDIKLIRLTHEIERMVLNPSCDNTVLCKLLNLFYFYNDLYISIEFARISAEINNSQNEYGSIDSQKKESDNMKNKYLDNYRQVVKSNEQVFTEP